MTDTITTRAVVPSTIPVRVNAERSLWLRISEPEVRIASPTFIGSLVAEGFDRVEARRLHRGIEAEDDADTNGEQKAGQHDLGRDDDRLLDELAHGLGEGDPETKPEHAAEQGDHDALHEELRHDVEAGGSQGLARPHLANAFVE